MLNHLHLGKTDRNHTTIPHLTKFCGNRSNINIINNKLGGEIQLFVIKMRSSDKKYFFKLHLQFSLQPSLPEQPLVPPLPRETRLACRTSPVYKHAAGHCSKHNLQLRATFIQFHTSFRAARCWQRICKLLTSHK